MAFVIAAGSVLPAGLAGLGLLRVWLDPVHSIDPLSAQFLSLAGILGIAGLVYGVWMLARRIGRFSFRLASFLLGVAALAGWPLAFYLGGLTL